MLDDTPAIEKLRAEFRLLERALLCLEDSVAALGQEAKQAPDVSAMMPPPDLGTVAQGDTVDRS